MARLIFFVFLSLASTSYGALSNWAVAVKDTLPSDDKVDPKEPILENSKLPPLISQDSLGICYASAAATVINFEMCKYGKIQDCKGQPESSRVSALGISRYTGGVDNGDVDDDDSSYKSMKVGGSASTVLDVATNMVSNLPSEKCNSLERILSKDVVANSQDVRQAQKAIWKNFEDAYKGYKATKGKCEECANKFYQTAIAEVSKLKLEDDQNIDPNLKNDPLKDLQAFKEDTYDKALNALLYPSKCGDAGMALAYNARGHTKLGRFPETDEVVPKSAVLEKIRSILLTKRPVILEDICLENCDKIPKKNEPKKLDPKADPATLPKMHSVVIAGYRKICPKGSVDGPGCRVALKVVNSYGKKWQDDHNNGWLEAEPLLAAVNVSEATLSWLADLP